MSLVDCGALFYPSVRQVPEFVNATAGGPATQLNATYLRFALIFQVPATGTIDKITYGVGTVTTSQQVRIGIYTLDSSGQPTSICYGGSAYVTRASVAASTTYTETLSSPASATKGDWVAIVVEWDSTAGDIKFFGTSGLASSVRTPIGIRYNGSAWSFPTYNPCFAPGYSSTYYDIGSSCFSAQPSAFIWNQSTAGSDEYALVWPAPFTCRVAGIWAYMYSAAGADFDAVLYEGTTSRASISVDGDVANSAYGARFLLFPTPYTIAAGTTYYLALKPTTANSIRVYYADAASSALVATFSGKSNMCLTSRLDLGSWAASTTTRRPMIGAIIDQVDDGAGGGTTIAGTPLLRGLAH